jgi:hypothetical protein
MNTIKLPIKYQLRLGHLLAELAGSELIEKIDREADQDFCLLMSEYLLNSGMAQMAELYIPARDKGEFLKYRQTVAHSPQQAAAESQQAGLE